MFAAVVYSESNPSEYVALFLQNGQAHAQYRLSASSPSAANVLSIATPINNNQWHKVELHRVGKLATLRVQSASGGGSSSSSNGGEKQNESPDDAIVFKLNRMSARVVLGMLPKSVHELHKTLSPNGGVQFRGSMDSLRFNGHDVGLWNYAQAHNVHGDTSRKFVAPDDDVSDSDTNNNNNGEAKQRSQQNNTYNQESVHFTEGSYYCLNTSQQKKNTFQFHPRSVVDVTLHFKTSTADGVLYVWYNEEKNYMSVFLSEGQVNVAFVMGGKIKVMLFDKEQVAASEAYRLDDNKWHAVRVTITGEKQPGSYIRQLITMRVVELSADASANDDGSGTSGEQQLAYRQHVTESSFKLANVKQCIGGMYATDRKGIFKDAEFNSFHGCMRHVSVNNKYNNRNNNYNTYRLLHDMHDADTKVQPHCPVSSGQCEIKRNAAGGGGSPVYLQFNVKSAAAAANANSNGGVELFGLAFVTANPNGVLLYRVQTRGDQTSRFLLELRDAVVSLRVLDSSSAAGKVVISLGGSGSGSGTQQQQRALNDNTPHVVYVVKRRSSIELRVDNELVDSYELDMTSPLSSWSSSAPLDLNSLYVAGMTTSEQANWQSSETEDSIVSFEGCILQIIYNAKELSVDASNSRSANLFSYAKCYNPQVRISLLDSDADEAPDASADTTSGGKQASNPSIVLNRARSVSAGLKQALRKHQQQQQSPLLAEVRSINTLHT